MRKRRIGNGTYFYIVESPQIAGKIRQKILEYLGREPDPARLRKAMKYWGVKEKPAKGKGRKRA